MQVVMLDNDTLRTAIQLAVRAPSIHNTQPWRWLIGDQSVHVFADRARQVPAVDPGGRNLVVSCGAALHHFRGAPAALGWVCAVHRLPNPGTPDHLASLEFQRREPSDQDIGAAVLISRRRSDRRRVIATSGDDVRSRLRAGEATSTALLAATELGLASCPLSQPLEIADGRRRVRDDALGGIAEPELVVRLGWAPTTAAPLPATPRRNIDDVIIHGDEPPVPM